MSFFIDSADIAQVKEALELGWITGVTTNPLLYAGLDTRETLQSLAELCEGSIFYQITSESLLDMKKEAAEVKEIIGDRLIIKLPPKKECFKFLSDMSSEYSCCVTAVYSVSQALIAAQQGADYVAVYVNRAIKNDLDGMALVRDLTGALDGYKTRVLAASIKSAEEAGEVIKAGARDITTTLPVLKSMMSHSLSDAAIEQFKREGKGIVLGS